MTLDDAKAFVMPFGKYKGQTLDEIAIDNVLYLDWLDGIGLKEPLKSNVTKMCKEYARDIDMADAERNIDTYLDDKDWR